MKIFQKIKETSILAVFSFCIAAFSYLLPFGCGNKNSLSAGVAALGGIIALVFIKRQKLRGKWFAILAIILGVMGFFVLVTFC
ncbi:MAG: hypothetical protein V1819_02820 [bacterium]